MSIEQSSLNSPLALDPERRDRLRRRRLTRNRLVASALLAVMATIYVATHVVAEAGSWILLLRAGAEAGVVGGLADWFAVTALFRHPLGLPIPTIELRYSDSILSESQCDVLIGDFTSTFSPANISAINPSGFGSKWCGQAFVISLKGDVIGTSNFLK